MQPPFLGLRAYRVYGFRGPGSYDFWASVKVTCFPKLPCINGFPCSTAHERSRFAICTRHRQSLSVTAFLFCAPCFVHSSDQALANLTESKVSSCKQSSTHRLCPFRYHAPDHTSKAASRTAAEAHGLQCHTPAPRWCHLIVSGLTSVPLRPLSLALPLTWTDLQHAL